jgi:hypothetical protein
MTKTEELIIAKAEEMVRFYNKLDSLTKEEAKKNGAEILDNHNLLRAELKELVERRKWDAKTARTNRN